MRRVVGVVVVLVCLALVFATRRCRSDHPANALSASPLIATGRGSAKPKPAPGSIAGRVIDQKGEAIAGANVCVSDERVPCVATDARGAYAFASLPPAHYMISASAKTFRPEARVARLAAGERQNGIDLRLRSGGAELTGVVVDASGGPIAGARISTITAVTESGPDGSFSLWERPGHASVVASAEGYARVWMSAQVPGRIEVALLPEAVISGVVIDARTNAPVPDVAVSLRDPEQLRPPSVQTDEHGVFRAAQLSPGRYTLTARSPHGFGRSEGSIVVGIGTQVSDVTIKLHPAVRVTGNIIVSTTKAPFELASVTLTDNAKAREVTLAGDNGMLGANGVLPGTYDVEIECNGCVPHASYPPVHVGTDDVTQTWEVDLGAKIEGTIRDDSGALVEDVSVAALASQRQDRFWRYYAHADADGHYVLDGMQAGSYTLSVRGSEEWDAQVQERIDVPDRAVLRRDFVIKSRGEIRGRVVDGRGVPLAGIYIAGRTDPEDEIAELTASTDAAGTFAFSGVQPGSYEVSASRPPGLGGKSTRATVRVKAKEIVTPTLVIEETTGSVTGNVVDADDKPVGDAFIAVVHDSVDREARADSAWPHAFERTIITNADGHFAVHGLPQGIYTVRASRRGIGEPAVVEHVPVGGTAKLRFARGGSIEGVVHSWSTSLDELTITAHERKLDVVRSEHMFRTAGAFALRDLPAGHFTITAAAEGLQASIEVDLAEGEHKTGVAIELAALVTVVGRTVDHITKKPIADVDVDATPVGGTRSQFSLPYDPANRWSDATGRFTIKAAPIGKLLLRCRPRPSDIETYIVRTIIGSGTVDVGDVPVIARRSADAGNAGLDFKENTGYRNIEGFRLEVSRVDANGPAARAGIQVGDIVTHIDGVDISGWGTMNVYGLLSAPAGTKLAFTLARGITVEVVLAKR